MEIYIEELALCQYQELTEIYHEQQKYHYQLGGVLADEFLEMDIEKYHEFLQEKQKEKEIMIQVAKNQENKIVGFGTVTINRWRTAKIEDLYVDPNYRGQKIGEKLMDQMGEWLLKKEVETIELVVIKGNEKVIQFYEKWGFNLSGYIMKKRKDNLPYKPKILN